MMETENHHSSSAVHNNLASSSKATMEKHQKGDMDKMREEQSSSNTKDDSQTAQDLDSQCPSSTTTPIPISNSNNKNNASDQEEASREDFCSSCNNPEVLDLTASDHHQGCGAENGMPITKFFIHEPLVSSKETTTSQQQQQSPQVPRRHRGRSRPISSSSMTSDRTITSTAPVTGFKHSRSSGAETNLSFSKSSRSSSSRRTTAVTTSSILPTPRRGRSIIDYKSIPTCSILPAPAAWATWAASSLRTASSRKKQRRHWNSRRDEQASSSCQRVHDDSPSTPLAQEEDRA